jgi:uncharacterized membrane protein YhhN
MLLIPLYSLSFLLLVALLGAKKRGSKIGEWFTKPTLSLAFIIVAVLQTSEWSEYHWLMVLGFVLCFLGDVFLIASSKKMFLCGLVSFLIGHLFYIGAFYQHAHFGLPLVLIVFLLALTFAAVFKWLGEHIDGIRGPVVAYMLVISVMVLMAFAVALNNELPMAGRVLLLGGAISFFVSDLFVIREEFMVKSFLNPLFGLPLYYGGQFALAISLAYSG